MFVSLIAIISAIVDLYCLVILVWVILSWFNRSGGVVRDIYNALNVVVAPYVNIFKRFIPPIGGLDLSPLAALLVLQLLSRLLLI
jgi:YggT family protein